MKKIGFICVSWLKVFCSFAQGQEELQFNHQFIYSVSYQTDSNDVTSRKQLDMELLANDELSLFRSVDRGKRDSVFLAKNEVLFPMLVITPVNKFNYQIIKKEDNIRTYDSAFGMNLQGVDQIYYYDESREVLDWKIKDDTLRIADMLCQRAEVNFGGRHWLIWFTPEIPIPDGPYKFCGLPGLIVSIVDTKGYWRFDLTNVRNVKKEVTINFQSWYKFVPTTKERLYSERRKFQDNLVATQEAAGYSFSNPASDEYTHEYGKREINKRMANDNNWIELFP